MRFLLKVTYDTETTNKLAREGTLSQRIQAIVDGLKPEAAYFLADNGKRAGYFIVDIHDASQIPAIAEPFFIAFNASIEASPVMTAADLAKAGPAIEYAAKTYG